MKKLALCLFLLFSLSAYSQKAEEVNVKTAGSLGELLTEAQQDTCRFLIVTGKLNSADIKVLRRMAGADGRGRLCELDLLGARIVSDKMPYLTIHHAEKKVSLKLLRKEEQKPPFFYDIEYPEFYNRSHWQHTNADFLLYNDADRVIGPMQRGVNAFRFEIASKFNTKGHSISQDEEGHYTYSAYTHKDLFCADMFYGCPNLQMVILPRKGKISDRVAIDSDPICYKIVTKAKNNKE